MLSLGSFGLSATAQEVVGSDFQVIKDKTTNGIRTVTAIPSEVVCSTQIDLEIEASTHIIKKCKFTRGCPGNTMGIGRLVEGMKTEDAIKKLYGIPCGQRPTSCPDQLAKVLRSLKW